MKFLQHTYFKSIQWGMFSVVVTFLNQILLIPALLTVFNKEIFAIWIILNTLVLMIRAINLGQLNFSSNVINLDGIEDDKKFNFNLKVAFNSNFILILVQLLVVMLIADKQIFSFITNIDSKDFDFHKLGWCVIVLSVSKILYQFFNLYVLRLLEPFGKINITIKYQVIGEFLDFIVILLSCFFFKNLLYICVSSLIVSILYVCFIHKYILKQGIKYYFSIEKLGLGNGVTQIFKSKFLTLSFLLEKFFEVGLNFIVTVTYSLGILPIFNTTRVMANSAIKVSNIIVAPMMPSIQRKYAQNDQSSIIKSLNNYWKFSLLFIVITFSIILPFIDELFKIWTQNKIEYNEYLFILILIAIILQNFNVVLVEIVKKTNQTKFILLMNLIKFCLILILFSYFGSVNLFFGIGYSVIIVESISILIFVYYFKDVFFKIIISNLFINLILILNLVLYQFYSNFLLFEFINLGLILLISKKYVISYIKRK